jgi:hypothetical protein
LFVHLDDPNEKIQVPKFRGIFDAKKSIYILVVWPSQEAVLEVILYIKAHHEAAVLKRAAASRVTHRTGHMCDRAIASAALMPK